MTARRRHLLQLALWWGAAGVVRPVLAAPAAQADAPAASSPANMARPARLAAELAAPDVYAEALAAPVPQRLALAASLQQDASARGLGLLWLLAHDEAPEVTEAALRAALGRCADESPAICRASLRFFLRPTDAAGAWLARQRLRALAPLEALQDASPAFRRDTAAYCAARLGAVNEPAECRQVLRRLAEDPDRATQLAASAALLGEDR